MLNLNELNILEYNQECTHRFPPLHILIYLNKMQFINLDFFLYFSLALASRLTTTCKYNLDQNSEKRPGYWKQIMMTSNGQSQARLKPNRCLVGFIFTLDIIIKKKPFVSYLNSPRREIPRVIKICV